MVRASLQCSPVLFIPRSFHVLLIRSVRLIIALHNSGGKRILKLPPELGYGMRGAGCRGGKLELIQAVHEFDLVKCIKAMLNSFLEELFTRFALGMCRVMYHSPGFCSPFRCGVHRQGVEENTYISCTRCKRISEFLVFMEDAHFSLIHSITLSL